MPSGRQVWAVMSALKRTKRMKAVKFFMVFMVGKVYCKWKIRDGLEKGKPPIERSNDWLRVGKRKR
jgi:hypothetical protein